VTSEANQYAIEQSKLRNEAGVLPEGRDIKIDPPTREVLAVNPEVYKDVEPMLFRGFLYTSAVINGVLFVFKSLNHNEFERIGLYGGLISNNHAAIRKHYDLFLAYGVYMVDGVNVLRNRDENIQDLVGLFRSLEDSVRSKIIFELSEINRRASRAVLLVEGYMLETASRLRWAQLRGLDLTSTAVTGVDGTALLGMNWGQFTWRALNHFEDEREIAEREW